MLRFTSGIWTLGLAIAPFAWAEIAAAQTTSGSQPTYDELQRAIENLDSIDRDTRLEALGFLSRTPCLTIGPLMVAALNSDSTFREPAARRLAFEALATCKGQKGEEVERALLAGLEESDSSIVASCARGLADASESSKAEGAKSIVQRWNHWVKPDGDPPMWIVESVTHLDATKYLFEKLVSGNGVTKKTALWTVGMLGASTNGSFNGDEAQQAAIRQFVLESLDSPSREVRQAAFESLIAVFGDDVVVFDSPTEYRLNPQIEGALEEMAVSDPDPGLRERAETALQQRRERLDHVAEKILRDREREKGEAESRGDGP